MMTNQKTSSIPFVFFGSSPLSVVALDTLEKRGMMPVLVVTAPDKKKGRGLGLSPNGVRAWADLRGIPAAMPEKLDAAADLLKRSACEYFIVVAYGKIIPKTILDIPPRGALNIHPSLLPRFRGASPVRSAILANEETGVSVMLLDEEMDHGPVVAQKKIANDEWPPHASVFEPRLIAEGADMLADIIDTYLSGEIGPQPQNHDVATYCGKIQKEDGLLDLSADARTNILKIRAYEGWPGTYSYFQRGGTKLRVQIVDAHIEGTKLVIDTVKPEGKQTMPYDDFLRSGATPA